MLTYKYDRFDWSDTVIISELSITLIKVYFLEVISSLPINFIIVWFGLVFLYGNFQK